MLQILLALGLATSPPAPPCCLQPAVQFTAAADAAGERRDNVLHFIGPAALSVSSYGAARALGADRAQARWIAVGTSVLAIVAKELYDESVAGRFGLEETAIGLGGVATGILIAERVIWPAEKREQ